MLFCDLALCDELLTAFCFSGKLCIEVSPADKIAFISEELCIGCGICSKVSVIGDCVRSFNISFFFSF